MGAPDECQFICHAKRMSGHWWDDVLPGKPAKRPGVLLQNTKHSPAEWGKSFALDGDMVLESPGIA
jgi:hypothetical protein